MALTQKQLRELNDRHTARSDFIARATVDSLQRETDAMRQKRIEHLLRPENYGELFNYYFGKDTPMPLADSESAPYHKAIYKELYHENFRTIFNLIFRGGAKSTHANLGYPFALKQTGKARFFLVVGANEMRAAMLLQDLQVQFEHNRRITDDFGTQRVHGSWADGIFETTDRCTFMALGIDQPFRGLRMNGVRLEYASIDDIEDTKRAQNKQLTNEYISKVTADIQGAFSTKSERTIINNNLFVQNGFVTGLMKKKGFDIKKIDTKHNQYLRNEFASLYLVNLTTAYFDRLNTVTWEPSWPEAFSKEACLRKIAQYKNDKETLSGEYYNTPINSGRRIKEQWIKMVKPRELAEYTVIVGNWDLAYSDSACYKAMATLGIHGNRLTVLDLFCRQTDISVALDYHFSSAKRIRKQNNSLIFYYDGSVSQQAVYGPVWEQAGRKFKDFSLPIAQKTTADKFTKIDTALSSVLSSGTLDFSDELENNPDWQEAREQMLKFEKGSKYPIDFPDALADAIIKAQDYLEMTDSEQSTQPTFGKRQRGEY